MNTDRKDITEIVEENREMLELVVDGDDESARMAQNILGAVGSREN